MVPEFFVVGGEIARQLPPECSRVTVQVEQVAGAVMARRIVIVFPVVQVPVPFGDRHELGGLARHLLLDRRLAVQKTEHSQIGFVVAGGIRAVGALMPPTCGQSNRANSSTGTEGHCRMGGYFTSAVSVWSAREAFSR